MKWPNHTDYQDAIQNPQICFEEADLKRGEAASDMLGLPRVMSGNFASVYELSTGDSRWAVRCFVRQVAGQQARYARLCQHLNSITLPWLVKFDYLLKGIMVQGDWYPIVKMEWVEGCPINNYIEQHLNEPAVLSGLAAQFRTLVNDLRKHKLAHGDFQHGNIMVTPKGELRLVDYDGMYCPVFGKGRSPELGHVNFQHPLRLADYYDDSLDNFSALVIYASLLALSEEPELWAQHYTGDNLILAAADFRNAQNSKTFERLKAGRNKEAGQIAGLLQRCCASPASSVPWFEETVVAVRNGTLPAMPEPVAAAPAQSQQSEGWWQEAQADSPAGTRPATREAPPAQGTRPSPPASGGSRPSGAVDASPRPPAAKPLSPPARPAEQDFAPNPPEDGKFSKLRLAVGAALILALICYLLSRGKSAPAPTPPPDNEPEAVRK